MIDVTVTAVATGELLATAEAPCEESALLAALTMYRDAQTDSAPIHRPCEARFLVDGGTVLLVPDARLRRC